MSNRRRPDKNRVMGRKASLTAFWGRVSLFECSDPEVHWTYSILVKLTEICGSMQRLDDCALE